MPRWLLLVVIASERRCGPPDEQDGEDESDSSCWKNNECDIHSSECTQRGAIEPTGLSGSQVQRNMSAAQAEGHRQDWRGEHNACASEARAPLVRCQQPGDKQDEKDSKRGILD